MLVNSWPLLFLLVWDVCFWSGVGSRVPRCHGSLLWKKQVDSAAEPILMVCALYVALDGLTIIINGALKGCGRQMVQVGWGLVFWWLKIIAWMPWGWGCCVLEDVMEMCPFFDMWWLQWIGNRDVFTNSSADIDPKNSQASSSWLWGHNLRKSPSIRWTYYILGSYSSPQKHYFQPLISKFQIYDRVYILPLVFFTRIGKRRFKIRRAQGGRTCKRIKKKMAQESTHCKLTGTTWVPLKNHETSYFHHLIVYSCWKRETAIIAIMFPSYSSLKSDEAPIVVASYYLLGLPFAWLMAWPCHLSTLGLALGGLLGTAANFMAFALLLARTQWPSMAQLAQQRSGSKRDSGGRSLLEGDAWWNTKRKKAMRVSLVDWKVQCLMLCLFFKKNFDILRFVIYIYLYI